MARGGTNRPRPRQWIRPPLQRRSDASLQRILDAAEALMEERSFSDITVGEIAKRARSSVGVFYSRFPDKLALLHHLDERFAEDAEEALAQRFTRDRWQGRPFSEACAEVVEFLFRLHARKRGMLKSVILQVRTNPNERFQQTGKRLAQAIERLADFLLDWRHDIGGSEADRTVRLALMMTISLIRDLVVFSQTTMYENVAGLRPEEAPAVLARMFRSMVEARRE
jgi:AcrR family transcriptional regulator